MEQNINVTVTYTTTKCVPAIDKCGMYFIFVSSEPVFSVEAAKKGGFSSLSVARQLQLAG